MPLDDADFPAQASGSTESSSLVAIVKGQRDRFRSRMMELETERDVLLRELDDQRAKAEKLLGDNVMLYEKIKYLESYAQVPSAALSSNQCPEVSVDVEAALTGPHVPGLAGRPTGVTARTPGAGARLRAGEDVETSYRKLYEERVNPFADFNRREKLKSYGNLSTAEKITLNSTRLVMASKFARTFVFFYSVALHGLVFATLYHFTHVAHAK